MSKVHTHTRRCFDGLAQPGYGGYDCGFVGELRVQDCAEPLSDGELERIFEEHDEKPHLTRMDEYTCLKCRFRATLIAQRRELEKAWSAIHLLQQAIPEEVGNE